MIQILGKSLRVDHVSDYKPPKDDDRLDEETKRLQAEGCAPKLQIPADHIKKEQSDRAVDSGDRLPQRLPIEKIEIKNEGKVCNISIVGCLCLLSANSLKQ